MDFHVALIGSGNWSRVHLDALSASPHVARVTLVGRSQSTLDECARQFPIVTATTTDSDRVLEDESVGLVDIVLPHYLHSDVALAALAKGKHVICEKPASLCLADFDRVCAAAGRVDRRFLVVMNQLYNPINRRIRQLIDQGAIGRPFLLVETAFSHHDHHYHDPKTWRARRATAGGGVLIDGGYHMVYKHLDWLDGCGTPQWLSADTAQLALNSDGTPCEELGEDFISYTVGYQGPLRIAGVHGWTLPATPAANGQTFVAGTDAILQLTGAPPLVIQTGKTVEIVDVPPGPTSNKETMHACLLDYVDCIATDRPQQQGTDQLARATLQIILAVYQSGQSGQRVNLGSR